MRHLKSGRKLNRNSSHRLALNRNLACAIIEHGRIETTVAKAKEFRPFIERLVTIARGKDPLHARREVIAYLGPTAKRAIDVNSEEAKNPKSWLRPNVFRKLFNEIVPKFLKHPGGYTRILKIHKHRVGDGGELCIIEFINPDLTTKSAAPVAPKVESGSPATV
jgi:large subunit ribosomal protein L17